MVNGQTSGHRVKMGTRTVMPLTAPRLVRFPAAVTKVAFFTVLGSEIEVATPTLLDGGAGTVAAPTDAAPPTINPKQAPSVSKCFLNMPCNVLLAVVENKI